MKAKVVSYGLLLAVTVIAYLIGNQFPLIGHSFAAIVLGMIVANTGLSRLYDARQMKKVSSLMLKVGVVLLGFTLSFDLLSTTALRAVPIILSVITGAFVTAFVVGKKLGVSVKSRWLIGAGTAICGGSAIAAVAPIIEADEDDLTYAISTIFIYNLLALVLFPILARVFGLSDIAYGVFAGTAINDTSSVVAAGYQFSPLAGDTATLVKMVRTLMIVPTSLVAIYWRWQQAGKAQKASYSLAKIFPTFILFFIIAIVIANVFALPSTFTDSVKQLSRLALTFALAAVGMSVSFSELKKAGLKTIQLGGVTWSVVIVISLVMTQWLFG